MKKNINARLSAEEYRQLEQEVKERGLTTALSIEEYRQLGILLKKLVIGTMNKTKAKSKNNIYNIARGFAYKLSDALENIAFKEFETSFTKLYGGGFAEVDLMNWFNGTLLQWKNEQKENEPLMQEIKQFNCEGICPEVYCKQHYTHFTTKKINGLTLAIPLCKKHAKEYEENEKKICWTTGKFITKQCDCVQCKAHRIKESELK